MYRVQILYQRMVTRSTRFPISTFSKHLFMPTPYFHTTSISSTFGHTIQPSNIVTSPYPDIKYSPLDLYSHVFQNFSRYGNKTALVDGISGQEYSFNQIDELTSKFSSGLNRLGFNKHDVLSIVAPNSTAFPIIIFGVIASGGILSTCNPTCTVEELAYQLKNSNARLVTTTPQLLPTVTEAVKDSMVEKIILIDGENIQRRGNEVLSFKSLLEDSGSLFNPVSSDLNETALLPYSSGTTGLPKGVMLTHQNITSNLLQLHHPDIFDLTKEGTCLIGVLPFVHLYGMVMLIASLCYGSRIVVLPEFVPDLFLRSLQDHIVSLAHLVPPLILFLAKHPLVERYDLSSLDKVITAAASVGEETVKAAKERIRCRVMCQCYGLTEACVTHVMADQLHMAKPGSIGPCLRSLASKIVNPESGVALGPGEVGELLLKGPNVMKGYLKRPDATKLSFTEDGWLRTGDIAYFDNDGCFYITDRLKELMKVKGLQVSPAELEAVLVLHPKVADAAVIGVPDEGRGEAPQAYVVKKENVSEREIMEFLGGKLAKHKHLTGGVKFVDTIPRSISGKILRRLLKDQNSANNK